MLYSNGTEKSVDVRGPKSKPLKPKQLASRIIFLYMWIVNYIVYTDFYTLPILDLHLPHILVLVHKFFCHKQKLLVAFANYFDLNKQIQDYNAPASNYLAYMLPKET